MFNSISWKSLRLKAFFKAFILFFYTNKFSDFFQVGCLQVVRKSVSSHMEPLRCDRSAAKRWRHIFTNGLQARHPQIERGRHTTFFSSVVTSRVDSVAIVGGLFSTREVSSLRPIHRKRGCFNAEYVLIFFVKHTCFVCKFCQNFLYIIYVFLTVVC